MALTKKWTKSSNTVVNPVEGLGLPEVEKLGVALGDNDLLNDGLKDGETLGVLLGLGDIDMDGDLLMLPDGEGDNDGDLPSSIPSSTSL